MKYFPFIIVVFLLSAVGFNSSCKHYATEPQDSVKCDTCGIDTTHPPCDTCNLNRDSLTHAFEWTEYTIPEESNLSGVAVFGDNSIYVFNSKLYVFDGTTWTQTKTTINNHTYTPLFTDMYVFGIAPQEYWCASGDIVYHGKVDKIDEFRLNQIGIYDLATDGPIRVCWGSSSNDMFFVGDLGTIFHYDGSNWTKFPKITNKNLRSVWGTSHNNVWAGGLNRQNGESVLLHYNGTAWENIELSTIGKFECANCDGISAVWAIDSSNHQLGYVGGSHFYRTNGNNLWINDSDRVGNKFNDGGYAGISSIRGNNTSDIFCCSDWGFASHWNGKTWMRYDILYDPQNFNYGTNAMDFHGNTVCLVGFKNGQSWIAVGKRK